MNSLIPNPPNSNISEITFLATQALAHKRIDALLVLKVL